MIAETTETLPGVLKPIFILLGLFGGADTRARGPDARAAAAIESVAAVVETTIKSPSAVPRQMSG